jgi:very-short-patch-repair endonuclease/predicted transcriptional regulator of viral defense system
MPPPSHVVHGIDVQRATADLELAALAASQRGVVSRGQLLGLGFGRGAIEVRLARGQLHMVHRGVYAVGHTALGERGRLRAALFACGRASVLSHRSAAHLWAMSPSASRLIEASGPTRRRGARGVRYHQARLHRDDVTGHEGFPVTSVARTLLDLAEVVPRERLARAVERAVRLRIFDLTAVQAVLARGRQRKGCAALATVIAAFDESQVDLRSELERHFLTFIRDEGLPKPVFNAVVEGLEVDVLWPKQRLVVELDGYAYHAGRAAFERDRQRDAILLAAGHRVMRVTDRQLTSERRELAARLRLLLAQ